MQVWRQDGGLTNIEMGAGTKTDKYPEEDEKPEQGACAYWRPADGSPARTALTLGENT